MKRVLTIMTFLTISLYLHCQDLPSPKNSLTIVFYNVENLFDTNNDPAKYDDEFTSLGPKEWNQEKYKKKITDLAKVLSSINERELPALIGLAEVENQKVLEDIASSSKLKKGKYGIVHFESKDENGTGVALLYETEEIELLDSKSISVISGKDSQDATRDILYVKCRIKGDNIYHVFVNHWPLRTPNEQESEIKRITTAIALRKEIDNILNFENNARIIIIGDFNDEPTSKSVFQILNASNKRKNLYYRDLYNLMFDIHNVSGEGSVINNNSWHMFDQIIVSQAVLTKGTGYYLTFSDGKVFRNEQVLTKDPATGTSVINQTYTGDTYNGGVSDHLPVYVILKKDEK
jgi:endonuclease/exonuclease/phosphatase family metal-dependent hydrolase